MSRPPLTIRRVDVWDMRRLFNEGGFIEKLRKQELTAQSVRCQAVDPGSPYIGQTIPVGSISQTLELLDSHNDVVAEIQRFIKPDGTIGASGRNDPKNLVIGGTFFRQSKKNNPVPRLSDTEINRILGKSGLEAAITHIRGQYYRLRY